MSTSTHRLPGSARERRQVRPESPIAPNVYVCVVVPAFNERDCIGRVVESIKASVPWAGIIVIDDGSQDGTGLVAADAGATVLRLPFNSGYGVALQTGLIYAQRCGAEAVVTMDADGQHEPSDITSLLSPVISGDADLVLGSRYLAGSHSYPVPLVRRLTAWMLAKLLSLITGKRITDTTTGFQCLNRCALESYVNLRDFPERYPDADVIAYAHARGCRISEVPVTMHADESGDSMHGVFKSMFYVPQMIVAVIGMWLAFGSCRSSSMR